MEENKTEIKKPVHNKEKLKLLLNAFAKANTKLEQKQKARDSLEKHLVLMRKKVKNGKEFDPEKYFQIIRKRIDEVIEREKEFIASAKKEAETVSMLKNQVMQLKKKLDASENEKKILEEQAKKISELSSSLSSIKGRIDSISNEKKQRETHIKKIEKTAVKKRKTKKQDLKKILDDLEKKLDKVKNKKNVDKKLLAYIEQRIEHYRKKLS